MQLKSFFKKFRYALLLGRVAGPIALVGELIRQIYSKSYFVGVEKDLEEPFKSFQTDIEYILRKGNQDDIDQILEAAKTQNKENAYEIVMRKMFYDTGFRNFYVARTKGDGELCYFAWLLSSREHPELRDGFKGISPIKESEVLMFNLFAFEKFRGTGLASSIDSMLCLIAAQKGYKRAIAYPLANNIAGIKALEKIGFKKCCWKFERRFLFSVERRFGNELETFPDFKRLPF
jgi:RimJ/RimL family protein N-acetyltransferase